VPASFVLPPKDAIWTWKAIHLSMSLAKPIFCRLSIEGRENIPATGGCVLTCNHTMGPDFLVIGYLSSRQICFMVKAELMERYGWLGRFLAYNGCFPVRRGDGDKEAIAHAVEIVRAGSVLGLLDPVADRAGRHCGRAGYLATWQAPSSLERGCTNSYWKASLSPHRV